MVTVNGVVTAPATSAARRAEMARPAEEGGHRVTVGQHGERTVPAVDLDAIGAEHLGDDLRGFLCVERGRIRRAEELEQLGRVVAGGRAGGEETAGPQHAARLRDGEGRVIQVVQHPERGHGAAAGVADRAPSCVRQRPADDRRRAATARPRRARPTATPVTAPSAVHHRRTRCRARARAVRPRSAPPTRGCTSPAVDHLDALSRAAANARRIGLVVLPKRRHNDAISFSTRSSWDLNGSLHRTVRCAWSFSFKCTQSTV